MKIKNLFIAAVAILLAASCQKATLDNTVVEGNGKVIFDITVDGANKAVGKTAWADGDQIVCFFAGDCTLGHQLRLTYSSSTGKWGAAFDDPTFIESLVDFPSKTMNAIHWDGTMTIEESVDNQLQSSEDLRGKTVLKQQAIPFEATQSGETVFFKANISLERYTNVQVVLTDVPAAEASKWTMESEQNWPEQVRYGALLLDIGTMYYNGSLGFFFNSFYECYGQTNADGAAFLCSFSNFNSDVILIFKQPSESKKYIKIIPEGQFEPGEMTGAFKTTLASCWEITDTTNYVCDADYHYYRTVKLKDGKWWMADNMRLVPKGLTPSNDLKNVRAGIYYPVVSNGSAAVFSTDASVIGKRGYLYQSETALGVAVGSLQTQDAAKALEGAKGICPTGWHIPTINEITGLVGKAVSPIVTKTDAPYYNGANGSIALLNQDKFNVDSYGAVAIGDVTRTEATLMGWMKTYPSRTYSGYLCGSSFANISYKTKDTPTSGIKNIQFYGFMPMTNKATEAEYTCNGALLSYLIGASVRCVKNAE